MWKRDLALVLAAVLALAAAPATAELVLYDDFEGTELDTSKWAWDPDYLLQYYQAGPVLEAGEVIFPGRITTIGIQTFDLPQVEDVGGYLMFEARWRNFGAGLTGSGIRWFQLIDGNDAVRWNWEVRANTNPTNWTARQNGVTTGTDLPWPVDTEWYKYRFYFENVDGTLFYRIAATEAGGDTFTDIRVYEYAESSGVWPEQFTGLGFAGSTYLDAPANLGVDYIKYEIGEGSGLVGDANRDGVVNDADLSLLLAHWDQDVTGDPDGGWGKGEFNATAPVNDNDLSLLLANWTGAGSAVPEPAAMSLLAFGGVMLIRRRAAR